MHGQVAKKINWGGPGNTLISAGLHRQQAPTPGGAPGTRRPLSSAQQPAGPKPSNKSHLCAPPRHRLLCAAAQALLACAPCMFWHGNAHPISTRRPRQQRTAPRRGDAQRGMGPGGTWGGGTRHGTATGESWASGGGRHLGGLVREDAGLRGETGGFDFFLLFIGNGFSDLLEQKTKHHRRKTKQNAALTVPPRPEKSPSLSLFFFFLACLLCCLTTELGLGCGCAVPRRGWQSRGLAAGARRLLSEQGHATTG